MEKTESEKAEELRTLKKWESSGLLDGVHEFAKSYLADVMEREAKRLWERKVLGRWAPPAIPKYHDPSFVTDPYVPKKGVVTRYAKTNLRTDYYGTVSVADMFIVDDPQGPKDPPKFIAQIDFPIEKYVIPAKPKKLRAKWDVEVDPKWKEAPSPADSFMITMVGGGGAGGNAGTPTIIADPSRYPHECPRCRAPAYIGFTSVECSRKSCA